jgi:hypothetical protein
MITPPSGTETINLRISAEKSIWQSRTVWGILLAALVLRILIVVYYTPRQAWSGDPREYLQWGKALAETGNYLKDPLRDKIPGIPALVAAGCWIGESGCRYFPLILFALCGCGAATACWWLLLPTLRTGARVPALLLLEFGILPALALGVGAISLLVAARRSHGLKFGCLAGALFGAAMYLRPDYMLVLFSVALTWSVAVYRELGLRRLLTISLLMVSTAFLFVFPWGLRNYRLTGEFRFFSDQGNRMLWWAFNDNNFEETQDKPFLLHTMAVKERSLDGEFVLDGAKQWVRTHPLKTVFLMGSRVISHLSAKPTTLVNVAATHIKAAPLRWIYRFTTIFIHETSIVIGLIALIEAWRRLPLSLVLLGVFAGTRIVFPGAFIPDGGRYALVFIPFLACCAIWFVGGFERESVKPQWFAIALAIFAIQVWLVFRWGLRS